MLDRALFADRIEIAELLKSKGAKAPNFEEEQNQMDQYKSQKLGVPQNMGWVFIFFLIVLVVFSFAMGSLRGGGGGFGFGGYGGGCGGGD